MLVDEVEERLKELILLYANEQGWEILALHVKADHCHLQISTPPQLAPSDIVAKIKRLTSRKLREEFEHLSHLPSLWTRAFFVSTEQHLSSDYIKQFIQSQKIRG